MDVLHVVALLFRIPFMIFSPLLLNLYITVYFLKETWQNFPQLRIHSHYIPLLTNLKYPLNFF